MSNEVKTVFTTPKQDAIPDGKRIEMSDQIDQLAAALATATGQFAPISKNAVNPHFKSRYADLASVIEATRNALSANGLSIVQSPVFQGGRIVIISRLLHKSGQWIETEVSLKAAQDTPQAIGSAITYGRRYGLSAILGVCADEDDDGNAGSKR